MLQAISNLNDMRGDQKPSRPQSAIGQSFTNQNVSNDTFAFGDPSNNKSFGSQGAVSFNKALPNNHLLSFQQMKRNELCEILREEIKTLQEDISIKHEMAITMKKQLELDQEAFLDK